MRFASASPSAAPMNAPRPAMNGRAMDIDVPESALQGEESSN